MAEKPVTGKRRIKDPETFRERAQKAASTDEKPRRIQNTRRASAKFASPLVRPFKVIWARLAGIKFVRVFIGKPLNIVGKILLPPFVRHSWHELRLVEWPSWRVSLRLTFAVLVFAIIFGVTVAAVDWGLDKIFRQLLV